MIYIGGIAMDSLSESIGVIDVVEKMATIQVSTSAMAKYDGLRKISRKKTVRVVSVEFDIFEDDMQMRRSILDDVLLWADGGEDRWLELDSKQGEHLIATCTKLPEISARDWGKSLKIEFTAYDPYWYSNQEMRVEVDTSAGTALEKSICVKGSGESCFLYFSIKNTGGVAMNTAKVEIGSKKITFASLGLAVGSVMEFSYDAHGFQKFMVGNTSVMAKRGGDDDLVVQQRKNVTVKVTTSTNGEVVLKARGCSL